MATYHVSKHASASNLNDGSDLTTNALATAYYGFGFITGGDTLKFGVGTYDIDRSVLITTIPNGSSGNPTIITDAGDGVVTFQHPGTGSAGLLNFSTGSHTYISFIGTAQDQLVFDGEAQAAIGALCYLTSGDTLNNGNFHFKNVEFKRCAETMVLGGRSPDNTFDNCTVHDNTVNNTPSAQTTPNDHAFYMSGNNLVIKNCRFYNIWGNAIHMFSTSDNFNYTGRQIINNTIWGGGYGSGTQNGKGIIFEEGGGIIHNNLIYAYGGDGIAVWRGRDVTVSHNTVHGCGIYGGYGIQVGFSGTNALRVLVRNNISVGNVSGDMRVTAATDTTVAWNVFGSSAIINSGVNTSDTNNKFSIVDTDEFVDSTNATLASRNYNLKTGASSIGVASTNEVPPVGVATDIVGTVRPQGAFVDQGAYEFTTGTGSAVIWQADVQNGSSWFDSGNTNNSVRCLVKGSVTTAGAAAIKVFFRGRSDASYAITKVSIVERDGSTLDGVDGTNTQITFGGTWAAGGTVPQGGELFSDSIAFALDGAKDYFVTYYASGSIGPGILGGSTDGVWRVAGDSAATIDWSGLTLVGTHLGTYGLFYLEEAGDPPPPPDAPVIVHSSPYIAEAGIYRTGLFTLNDGDLDVVSVVMVGTDLVMRTTPTANVTVASP